MKSIGPVAPLLLAFLIGGCSSGMDQRYLDTSLGDRLELPPNLIETAPESSFDLPDTINVDGNTGRGQRPVLARVDSVKLQGSGDLYWLDIEDPVADLYRLVKSFWASEGYRLVVDEPAIGIMQTEWIYKEEGAERKPDNWFMALFSSSDLSATQDQFRTRIERGPDGKNRIFITHRGTEYQHVLDSKAQERERDTGKDTANDWRIRQSDPELEVEMLSRLMIYLGLQQADVDQQVSDVGLFEPRAFMQMDSEEKSPYLLIKDPYQIAWNRVLHYLEQMNFEVQSQEFHSGFSGEGVIYIKTLVKENPDEGGFFSFQSIPETRERQLILVLSEESHDITRVNIENDKGEIDTTPAGAELLRLLYQRIK